MTAPVVVIGCGASKRELLPGERVPIVDLYTGHLFRMRLAYARMFGGPHYVVSGHHGLVDVDTEVVAYDVDLRGYRDQRPDLGEWRQRVGAAIEKRIDPSVPIIALVAGPYAAPFHDARAAGRSVEIPAEGLPIGKMLRFLKMALRGRQPESVDTYDDGKLHDFGADAAAIREQLEREHPADDEEWLITTGALRALLATRAA